MRKRKPQWVRFAELLKSRPDQWISVREFSQISVQHGARFNQLRAKSYVIKNRMESRDGLQFSYYKLISGPGDEAGPEYPAARQEKLFQLAQSEQRAGHFLEPELQRRL